MSRLSTGAGTTGIAAQEDPRRREPSMLMSSPRLIGAELAPRAHPGVDVGRLGAAATHVVAHAARDDSRVRMVLPPRRSGCRRRRSCPRGRRVGLAGARAPRSPAAVGPRLGGAPSRTPRGRPRRPARRPSLVEQLARGRAVEPAGNISCASWAWTRLSGVLGDRCSSTSCGQ